ncbi:MAG: hypothetical protein WBB19_04060 [Desulforhopalus sp.]
MSDTPYQLDEVHTQVENFFRSHPLISVRPTKGDPPDHYEITYSLTGMCKKGKGEVVESTDHTVELAIPFGFPHFPPSCKPKSDIFHPDFDPAAICLGDFWEQNQSLPDLIIHIGKMINGEIYSAANAFNEDAAGWYQENSDKFPLTDIQWSSEKESTSSAPGQVFEIDTLDDTDLTTEFDFLALEKDGTDDDISLDTSFPEVDSPVKIDLELLNLLRSQKRFYTLLAKFADTPQPSAQLSQCCQIARDEIEKVETVHSQAKKFENRGEAQIALEKYQQVAALVSDFPNIDSDIRRADQTLALLNDINPDNPLDFQEPGKSKEPSEQDKKPSQSGHKEVSHSAGKVKAGKLQNQKDGFFPTNRNRNKFIMFLFLGLLAIGTGVAGYLWHTITAKLSDAEEAYAQCSTFHANNQFDAAKRSCDKALQLVGEVKFIHQDFAQQLEKFIVEILQSEKLTQGLAGNIFLDGRYIPKDEAKTHLAIQQKLNEAESLFIKEDWPAALQLFNTLLTQADINTYLAPTVVEELRNKQLITEFRMSYDPAQELMKNSQWESAIEKLLQAQKILVNLAESDRGRYSEKLQVALQKSQFENLKQQGDLSFTGSDWLSAIETYNLALASSQKNALPPESIDAIRNNIKRAEIYTTINTGNKAFASGAWDEAIEAYNTASALLIGNSSFAKKTDSNINIRKLARIILQASIIRDRQIVQSLLEDDDLVKAKQMYQHILTGIADSSFGAEPEFINITAEINTAIQSLTKEIALMQKIDYLKNNYQSLFIGNYPTAAADELSNPVITKTKETASNLIFRMQCTENDGGRPLTLVMFYAYDKKTGQWSLFSEN